MWCGSTKLIGLIVAVLMFSVGGAVDRYLRANVGPTCFGCSTFACKIVTLADDPVIFLMHPIEGIELLFN